MATGKSGEPRELVGKNLVLGYAESEHVIDGETVSIPTGEISAFVGPNGSGKSTLLNALARQLEPRAGTVVLDGQDIHSLSTKALARKLGLLSQENNSPGQLEVENLVYYGRYPHRGFFEGISSEDVEMVERAISLTGIDHLRERTIENLSGGQKQLAWIAMVLAQETAVLRPDEPTTVLEPHHQLAGRESGVSSA